MITTARVAIIGVSAVLGLLYQSPVNAQPSDDDSDAITDAENAFSIRFGGGHSDNVHRLDTAEESESYIAFGLDLTYARQTRRLQASVTSDLEHRNYSGSGVSDEPYGSLVAEIEFEAKPDRITWW